MKQRQVESDRLALREEFKALKAEMTNSEVVRRRETEVDAELLQIRGEGRLKPLESHEFVSDLVKRGILQESQCTWSLLSRDLRC